MGNLKTAIDIDGTEAVSKALLDLLNDFPGIPDGLSIKFATLDTGSGIGFFPTSGAVLLSNKEDITGHVKQVCLYPFNVIYRAAPYSENQKLRIMEFLDLLGKWLELQSVVLADGADYKLTKYPDLQSGNRVIKSIYRTNAGHLYAAYSDGIEDWMLSATLRYENEYDK